jgi:hypothetical protein
VQDTNGIGTGEKRKNTEKNVREKYYQRIGCASEEVD